MSKPKDNETAKTVIVIGAGASADFRGKDDEEILAEVRGYRQDGREEMVNHVSTHFQNISKPKSKNQGFNMPTGEELIAKICKLDFLGDFFLRLHAQTWNVEFYDDKYLFKKWRNMGAQEQMEIVKNFIKCLKEGNSAEKDQYLAYKKFKPYFTLSRLVAHYQPFSIDEFLDSIKNNKIDLNVLGEDAISNLDLNESNQGSPQDFAPNSPAETLLEAGKTLIALFLLRSEDKKLFDYNAGICWYRHLRGAIITCANSDAGIKNKINGNSKEEDQTKPRNLTIISFNYDRSLDFFLRTRLGNFYEDIKVIYPYGELLLKDQKHPDLNFDWDSEKISQTDKADKTKGDYQSIPYGSLKEKIDGNKSSGEAAKGISWDEFEKIKKLGAQIQVIGELEGLVKDLKELKNQQKRISRIYMPQLSERGIIKYLQELKDYPTSMIDPELIKRIENHQHLKTFEQSILPAIEALKAADKIYFLGFAFHEQNCRLLGLEEKDKSANKEVQIFYTNYGNSKALERRRAKYFDEQEKKVAGEDKPSEKHKFNSSQKGVYDALLQDFALDFLEKLPSKNIYAF